MRNTPIQNLEKLKEGYLFWNDHRNKRDDESQIFDFSNLEIKGDYWRYNEVKGANLQACKFTNAVFRDIDFLDIDFSGSDFTGAQLINVHFNKCLFSENSFEGVILLDTSWYHSSLEALSLSKIKSAKNIHFFKCAISKKLQKEVDPTLLSFEECTFI